MADPGGAYATGCGCPYDEHDSWCPTLNLPPAERDGLRVGDEVLLVPRWHGPWPARIVKFSASSECCMVVEWLGRSPSLTRTNTICRRELVEVRLAATTEAGESRG